MDFATILAWLIAAVFAAGAAINFLAPPSIRADYARWGYPGWFHFATAALELAVVSLLLFPQTRLAGSVLGGFVMAAAIATTLKFGEYNRAIAPSVVLLLAGLLGGITALS